MRIALAIVRTDHHIESIHPPLGLIALRSRLLEAGASEVAILDGFLPTEIASHELSEEYDLVGLQVHALNASTSVELGRTIRSLGCPVVLGGPEISISSDLSWCRGAFDLAVRHHVSLQVAEAILQLPNHALSVPRTLEGEQRLTGRISYGGLIFDEYWRRAAHLGMPRKHAPIITHLGCSFRDRTRGGCSFCVDLGLKTSLRCSDSLESEVAELAELGVTHFHCVGENLAQGIALKLRRSIQPPPLSTWSFFARASEIHPVGIAGLKSFGLEEIRLGAESGDPHILQIAAKGETLESIQQAIEVLHSQRIKTTVSFVLGLPGESHKSLEKTCNLAQRWTDQYDLLKVSCSLISPMAGSELGRSIGMSPGCYGPTARKKFLATHTSIGVPEIEAAASRIERTCRTLARIESNASAPWQSLETQDESMTAATRIA